MAFQSNSSIELQSQGNLTLSQDQQSNHETFIISNIRGQVIDEDIATINLKSPDVEEESRPVTCDREVAEHG